MTDAIDVDVVAVEVGVVGAVVDDDDGDDDEALTRGDLMPSVDGRAVSFDDVRSTSAVADDADNGGGVESGTEGGAESGTGGGAESGTGGLVASLPTAPALASTWPPLKRWRRRRVVLVRRSGLSLSSSTGIDATAAATASLVADITASTASSASLPPAKAEAS